MWDFWSRSRESRLQVATRFPDRGQPVGPMRMSGLPEDPSFAEPPLDLHGPGDRCDHREDAVSMRAVPPRRARPGPDLPGDRFVIPRHPGHCSKAP